MRESARNKAKKVFSSSFSLLFQPVSIEYVNILGKERKSYQGLDRNSARIKLFFCPNVNFRTLSPSTKLFVPPPPGGDEEVDRNEGRFCPLNLTG